ncbi:hypothetical protein [Clostridium sp.]|uniref:hypothetical protein n=1 Tax=Clostridium sp. TaxID=1506 RepID=UPI0032169DD6
MINNIPDIIYDREGNAMRVVKTSIIFFQNQGKQGYVFHIEREEKITSISEFEIVEDKGRFIVTRDVLKNCDDI